MAKKAALAKMWSETVDGVTYNYTGPFVKVHGHYPVTILKRTMPMLVATYRCVDLKLAGNEGGDGVEIKNPRLPEEVKGNATGKGQKRLQNYLVKGEINGETDAKIKSASDRLGASIELHGGQTETIWVWKGQAFDGNRRLARFLTDGIEEIVSLVLPDEATEEEAFALMTQKHNAGPLEWPSFAKSYEAYRALVKYKWSLDHIVAHFQFSSEQAALKYIHSYVWYDLSGLNDPAHWSKFHHAYVPTLYKIFGYNKDTRSFDPMNRQPATKNGPTPEEVDKLTAEATGGNVKKVDFEWFVNLIKDRKVTDCRHADGIVAPAVREVDDVRYGAGVMQRLNTNVKSDGRPQAEIAWEYLKSQRQENAMNKKAASMLEEFGAILDSRSKIAPYLSATHENVILRTTLQSLAAKADAFAARLPKVVVDDGEAGRETKVV